MQNIFVLCPGRTASTTFAKACSHITNFTSAHESRVGVLSGERLKFADKHIEIDNRLVWFLLPLQDKFDSNTTLYVHLTRDQESVAKSYAERWHLTESIVKAYAHGILMKSKIDKAQRFEYCLDYVKHVDSTIELFMKDKPNTMQIDVTQMQEKFPEFYQRIGAEGSLQACLDSLGRVSNKNNSNFIKRTIKSLISR